MTTTKLAQLESLMAANDWRGALKLAATFARLGAERAAITRGWEAVARPQFYRDLGQNPDQHVACGIAALRRRYLGESEQ